ncbi:MAG: hypothetical protein J5661_08160 [Bacteroidaceae bacterium]|nr:hypothetical protein [Bacteroidaceae bacterium]
MKMSAYHFLAMLGILSLTVNCTNRDTDVISRRSPIEEPYKYISGGAMSGPAVPDSPDPLVRYVWDNPRATDSLQIYVMLPKHAEVVQGDESFSGVETACKEKCTIRVAGEGIIRLDFGVELPAWIEMDSPDLSGEVEMGISEHNEAELLPKVRKPVQYGQTYRLELNRELYEGVRYGFIHVKSFDKPFTITAVRAVCQVKPANYTGSFACDNSLINKIWYTGAYDVRANLREDCFGAILMDRGDRFSWTGDAYPAQAASLVAFSNYDEVLKNLQWTDAHPNGIETYEMYWVESLIDYYMYSGDEEGLRALLPKAIQRLDHAWDIFDEPTNLVFIGWDQRLGTGFDHPNCEEGICTFRMLAIGAWKHLAEVLRMIGEDELAARQEERAAEKTALFCTPENLARLGMHSSADAINANLLPDLSRLYHKDLSDRVHRLSYSPFNQCFLLKAMARVGHYDDAFASIRDQWGGQVEYGGTCFFEVYRPDWNEIVGQNGPIPYSQAGFTSLAHPWGAGVTQWLSEEMLGIKPTSGGFRTFSVKPHFSGFATCVSGQTNTPHGTIKASFDLKTGCHSLSVPEGTEALLAIPKEGMTVEQLKVNGSRQAGYREDGDFIYLPGLQAGEYEIRTTYSGNPTKAKEEEYVYATKVKEIDRDTHGRWFTKYGKDGYCIVGGAEDGGDLQVLPEYVESVIFDHVSFPVESHRTTVIKPLNEEAMLPVSAESDARKAFGCYYSAGCQMTPLEVRLRQNQPYRLAVYYADCDNGGRDFLIEAFDLATMNRITPCTHISDLASGVYVVFEYDRSIRVMASHLHGDNSLVNAVFFDPTD